MILTWLSPLRELGVTIGTPRELADNGALERYFVRDGISFDPAVPSFSVTPLETGP